MSAFDTIFGYSNIDKMADFRQALVGNKRATLMSGTFATDMALVYPDGGQQGMFDEYAKEPKKLYTRVGKVQHPGLIFDTNGTEKALDIVATGGVLKLHEDFSGSLKFRTVADRENWAQAETRTRRRCLARNVDEMVKKTEINYRTHGDRLHYLVVGLMNITTIKGESGSYPLFLLSCSELNRDSLSAEVEQTGFANFAIDRLLLQERLSQYLNGYEIEVNHSFAGRLNELASHMERLEIGGIDRLTIDPKFSALTVVTGFEAEYIDPVWGQILQGGSR